ncbi:hypothetical protein [Seleniivibrio woodruffii]|uniref:hypothetical protein n=1 Tax=Seleniivibrio woodruffii TaxID=1078050 RepID=UPI00240A0049|nr:hypothetical protein [Seleniivibrio woodruffii]
MNDTDYNDNTINAFVQLNEANKTLNSVKDLVLRMALQPEDERDYAAFFDDILIIVMEDGNQGRIELCG